MKFRPTDCQEEALSRSNDKNAFGYLMEMGLAKTATDLYDTGRWIDNRDFTRAVVVAPNSFKGGWVEEINKWEFPITPHIYKSGNDWENERFLKQEFHQLPMVIVNYEAIRSDKTQDYIKRFIEGRYAKITYDESIQISTHNSSQTKAAIELSKMFSAHRILSGKWITRGPDQAWSQLRAMRLLDGYMYHPFKHKFCEMGGFKGKVVKGAKNEEAFGRLIDPHVFKAFKAQYLHIGKNYTKRAYDLHPIVARHYREMMQDFITFLGDGTEVSVEIALSKYAKMTQIQSGFIYDEQGNYKQLVEDKDNSRLQTFLDFFDTECSSKLIVPYVHKPVLDMLMRNTREACPAFIKGGMHPDEIEDQKRRFNDDPSCRIIYIQMKAGKYGHTLLGGPEPLNMCHTMAFFENTYSLDDRSQIEDRNHRWGQLADNCTYADFIGTEIDYKMINALVEREDMFQTLMSYIGRK